VRDSSGPSWGQRTRASLERSSLVARCGLAWDKAHLGAPGLGGRSPAFLSILRAVLPLPEMCGPLNFHLATIVFPQTARLPVDSNSRMPSGQRMTASVPVGSTPRSLPGGILRKLPRRLGQFPRSILAEPRRVPAPLVTSPVNLPAAGQFQDWIHVGLCSRLPHLRIAEVVLLCCKGTPPQT
jgi:hypothetical protein